MSNLTLNTRSDPVVTKHRPDNLRLLLICHSAIGPLERHLQETGRNYCEEAAFLSGYIVGDSIGIVTTAILPYTESSGGTCILPLDVTANIYRNVKEKGQLLLAQIHTHPGRHCDHSLTDDNWALCDCPGFFSIIVPAYARFGLERLFCGGAVVKERTKELEWRLLNMKEIQERFRLVPNSQAVF